jgi:hypothetical protein
MTSTSTRLCEMIATIVTPARGCMHGYAVRSVFARFSNNIQSTFAQLFITLGMGGRITLQNFFSQTQSASTL